MGIGTMSRGEKAVIYVTSQYLNQCTFMPIVEGIEELHIEVELVHFIQVWWIHWCCSLHYWCQLHVYIFLIVVLQHVVFMSLDCSYSKNMWNQLINIFCWSISGNENLSWRISVIHSYAMATCWPIILEW